MKAEELLNSLSHKSKIFRNDVMVMSKEGVLDVVKIAREQERRRIISIYEKLHNKYYLEEFVKQVNNKEKK